MEQETFEEKLREIELPMHISGVAKELGICSATCSKYLHVSEARNKIKLRRLAPNLILASWVSE